MVDTVYERKGGTLKNLETGKVENFATKDHAGITICKHKSRKLQEANGGLGCGYVRVVR